LETIDLALHRKQRRSTDCIQFTRSGIKPNKYAYTAARASSSP